MKQALIGLALSLSLLLVGCTVTQPPPAPAPTATEPATAISATLAATNTPTAQPSATSTQFSATITATPTATPLPTVTPLPTATQQPTAVPTRPPDIIDPSLPPPTGQIFMVWDPHPPEPVDGYDIGLYHYNLYQLIPGTAPALNIIETAPSYIPNSPYVMNVSPDQSKIALLLTDDTNGSGELELYGGYDTDNRTIHIYDIVNETLFPFQDGEYDIPVISWLSDSQALLYTQDEQILLAKLDNSPPELFLNFPDSYIYNLSLSPDNRNLLIFISNNYRQVLVYDLYMGQASIIDQAPSSSMAPPQWASDSQWLTFGQNGYESFRPLSLYNAETKDFTVSVASDEDIVSMPAWSPDGQWLAFTANQTSLSLWDRSSLTVTEILTDTFVSPPIWAPTGNQVTVGLIKNNVGKLLAIDVITGAVQEWEIGNDIQEIRVLSWSPDSNWIAFFVTRANSSSLYLASKQGEKVYLMLDATGKAALQQFLWLPNPQ